jgi:hypothetical protein
MMKSLFYLVLLLSLSLTAQAHQDTPIKLKKDGSLTGLPERYGIASFDRATFTLRIGKNRISLPDCVTEVFSQLDEFDITFSASWYHDPELTPLYIHMDIHAAGASNKYQVFFNLETLEIFEINLVGFLPDQYSFEEQEISKECQLSISNAIIKENN